MANHSIIPTALLAVLFGAATSMAQSDSAVHSRAITNRHRIIYGLTAGYHFCGSHFLNAGLESRTNIGRRFRVIVGMITEARITDDFAIGQVFSMQFGTTVRRVGAALATGIDLAYYSDFKRGGLLLRPTIGIEGYDLRLAYGYNLFGSSGVNDIGRHNLLLTVRFGTLSRN